MAEQITLFETFAQQSFGVQAFIVAAIVWGGSTLILLALAPFALDVSGPNLWPDGEEEREPEDLRAQREAADRQRLDAALTMIGDNARLPRVVEFSEFHHGGRVH